MHFYNLIHIADDVEFMQAPLSNISAIPFENELGKIIKFIWVQKVPWSRLCLAELDASPDFIMRRRSVIGSFKLAKESTDSRLTI